MAVVAAVAEIAAIKHRPPVSFAPISAPSDIVAGRASTLAVTATVNDPAAFSGTVYAVVVDDKGVLDSTVSLGPLTGNTLVATLRTAAGLSAGRYTGTLQIKLCRDAGCSAQYPGSPVSLPYDIIVNARPFSLTAAGTTSFTVHQGGVSGTVALSGTADANWTATSDSAWLRAEPLSGTGNVGLTLRPDAAGLAMGKYTGTVTVKTADGRLATQSVQLEILPTAFVFSKAEGAIFTAVNGAPIPPQSIQVDLNNAGNSPWQASSTQSWLKISPLTGTAPAEVTLTADANTPRLGSGTYNANAEFVSTGLASASIPVKLNLVPATLAAPGGMIYLGGIHGRFQVAQPIDLTLNTGSNSWPFTVTGLPSWLSAPAGGNVGGAAPASFSVGFSNVAAPIGSTVVNARVTALVNGDTLIVDVPLSVQRDQRRLLPQRAGIGLASTPLGQVLTRVVQVGTSYGAAVPWSASSDTAWLAVATAGNQLTVTANPATLPDDAISYATVTLTTSDADVEPSKIRVALWKGTTGAVARTINTAYQRVVADTIRPWVYASALGASIDVVNAHTGAIETTVTLPGTQLDAMAVSPDGGLLYLHDNVRKEFAVLRLPDFVKLRAVPQRRTADTPQFLAVGRPSGVEVLYAGSDVYRVSATEPNGHVLGGMTANQFAVSPDGQSSIGLGIGESGIQYSVVNGGLFLQGTQFTLQDAGNVVDAAYSPDATRVYSAAASSVGGYRCVVQNRGNGTTPTALPGGDAYPNNIEVTSDGRAICGIQGWYSTYDFWVHTPAGALVQGYKVAGYARALLPRQLVVSADGGVVVVPTDDPKLAIVPIGY
ncbi:BACON domain-containing protein [Roseateles sp. UC29_93]|uniref:BACON domain-containing protein n=1 Tax=Roseateles sp. UC29_93 TaxID=3350177 RepID=UPI00366B3E74